MALEQTTKTGKAVGTRDRVVGWLATNGDVADASGMASTVLARSIGYPGSSIAFAQLLSGMERSGLITRDVRGKRTYRVTLTDAGRERAVAGPRPARRHSSHTRYAEAPAGGHGHVPGGDRPRPGDASDVDYDELARRLLLQVARRLTGERTRATLGPLPVARGPAAGDTRTTGHGRQMDELELRLSALELELLGARAARVALQEENEELRTQLERIRNSLGVEDRRPVQPRSAHAVEEVDHRDMALLQQMLIERQGQSRRRGKADSA